MVAQRHRKQARADRALDPRVASRRVPRHERDRPDERAVLFRDEHGAGLPPARAAAQFLQAPRAVAYVRRLACILRQERADQPLADRRVFGGRRRTDGKFAQGVSHAVSPVDCAVRQQASVRAPCVL